MTLISSISNPTIKRIRSLHQRRARNEAGVYFVEGIRIVGEALDTNAPVESLIVAPDLLVSDYARDAVENARQRGIRCIEVTTAVFESLSTKEGPQGIAAIIRQDVVSLASIAPGNRLCWVALESAQDPGNIGTILRTCDAVGASGLIMLGDSADVYDPSAVRASMGALFALTIARTSFDDLLAWKHKHSLQMVGTSDKAASDYQAVRYQAPIILLMGSERQGLSPIQQAACDHMVGIPMVGRSDSLNLAIATGVMLYELFNQQRNFRSKPG